MRNNIYTFVILFITIFLNSSVLSSEQFNFNVSEIEILDEGNKIIGSKGGTVTSVDGVISNAENFVYLKTENILNAKGNVVIEDKTNNFLLNIVGCELISHKKV